MTSWDAFVNHSFNTSFNIRQIVSMAEFEAIRDDLAALLLPYHAQLLDDYTAPDEDRLLDNLSENIPFLWVGFDDNHQLVTAASLDQIIPNKDAYFHGVRHAGSRYQPIVAATALVALETAFQDLNTNKVKIEFNHTNLPVKGFCWQFGFKKEAHFKNDSHINGKSVDVMVYSLTSEQYNTNTRSTLTHVLWQKKQK